MHGSVPMLTVFLDLLQSSSEGLTIFLCAQNQIGLLLLFPIAGDGCSRRVVQVEGHSLARVAVVN